MDLILWRTAEAEENSHDLERKLTAKGRRQCERVAGWLDHRLPSRFSVLTSPALRVLLILLSGGKGRWAIKKGGLWWVTNRMRGEEAQVVVRAVVSPELL